MQTKALGVAVGSFLKRGASLSLCVVFLSSFLASSVQATTNRFSVFHFRPGFGEGDLLTTLGTENLQQKEWRFASQIGYFFHPLEFTQNGARVSGVIDHLAVQHFEFAFAPKSWWEFNVELPAILFNRFTKPIVPIPASEDKAMLGDILLRSRFTLLSKRDHRVGVGLVPFVTLPTGNHARFVGESSVTGGAMAVFDANLGEKFDLNLNVGVEGREHVVFNDYDVKTRFLGGVGGRVHFSDNFSLSEELVTATPINDLFAKEVSSPTELQMGLNYQVGDSGFSTQVGAGLAIARAAGTPLFNTKMGLSYVGKMKESTKKKNLQRQKHETVSEDSGVSVEKNVVAKVEKPQEEPQTVQVRDVAVKSRDSEDMVFFAAASAALSDSAKEMLNSFAKKISKKKAQHFLHIEGHADSIGAASKNKELSLARSLAVAYYLVGRGLSALDIEIKWFGESAPLADNKTSEGRAHNRRVEVKSFAKP